MNEDELRGQINQDELRGQLIARLREDRLWTREELAKHAGVTPTTVSQAEAGRTHVRLRTIGKLADALGVPAARLLRPTEEKEMATAGKVKAPREAGPTSEQGYLPRSAPEASEDQTYEKQHLPTAKEMDNVTANLERLVDQRHKNIDRWGIAGLDALEEAIWGAFDMDAANDQLYRDLQDKGADRVLERWEETPGLVADLDVEAAVRQRDVFSELLDTAVKARSVVQELSEKAEDSMEDLTPLFTIRRKDVGTS